MLVVTPNPIPDREVLDDLAVKAHNFQLRTYLSSNPLPAEVFIAWGESELLWKQDCQRLMKTTSDSATVAFLDSICGRPPP